MHDDEKQLANLLALEEMSRGITLRGVGASNSVPTEQPTPPSLPFDVCQWQIGPNSTFRPGASTRSTLPAGSYVPRVDQHGLYLELHPTISDDIVELPESANDRVLTSIRKFWKSKTRYEKRGLLFKRGVLLWGPPGSGKTVTVQLLVRDLIGEDGVVLFLDNSPELAIGLLASLRKIEPDRPLIVVYEDLDEIIQRHGEHQILSMLDGENQLSNIVSIATCFTPDVRFLTSDLRWVPCGDLRKGDELWAFDEARPTGRGARRRYRKSIVTRSHPAKKECVRVTLNTGESFICTTDHPWLSERKGTRIHHKERLGWTKASDLLQRPELVRPFMPWTVEASWEAGWLAGMLDGEGSVSGGANGRGSTITVAQNVGPTADRLADEILKRGDAHVYLRKGRHGKQQIVDTRGGVAASSRLIGRVRAERLISRFNIDGGMMHNKFPSSVVCVEPVGIRTIQSVETTTHTYIAEGFACHNTNYPDRLGARIVNRPSRFDERIYVGMPSEVARRTYLGAVAGGDVDVTVIDKWVGDTDGFSIAHLREMVAAVLCLDQPYDDVISRLKSMCERPKEVEGEGFLKRRVGLA